jgi:Cytochrome c peroxidase
MDRGVASIISGHRCSPGRYWTQFAAVGTQETVNGQSARSMATGAKDTDGKPHQQSPPDYNPYPPGILPSNLKSEIARVLREVDFIEKRALARWRALPPPTLTGQPPTLQNTGTEAIETLGELMNFDRNMSPGKNQACSSCHMPYVAFSGPIPSVNLTMIAYPGTVHFGLASERAEIHLFTVLPGPSVQPRPGSFLWREFL